MQKSKPVRGNKYISSSLGNVINIELATNMQNRETYIEMWNFDFSIKILGE